MSNRLHITSGDCAGRILSDTGLGTLERLAMEAIRSGCETPGHIFDRVAGADSPPHFWGDTLLWKKINGLSERKPPLVKIEGPARRLPQWESDIPLNAFRVVPIG